MVRTSSATVGVCVPSSGWHRAQPRPRRHSHTYTGGAGPARYAGTKRKVFTLGICGPVGSGKTALVEALCRELWPQVDLAVITNDIYTHEDAEFLSRRQVLPLERIVGVQTGGCPHTAIRDDASANMSAVVNYQRQYPKLEMVIVESGGDNLTAVFSRELADQFIFIIDVAEGDKIPRKGGPGICTSDLLVINKIDLAPHVGADLEVMRRDSLKMRGERPFLMISLRQKEGIEEVVRWVKAQLASHVTRFLTPAGVPRLRVRTETPLARVGGARIELLRSGDETCLGTCYQQIPVRVMPAFRFDCEPAALLYLINLTAGFSTATPIDSSITARAGSRAVVTGNLPLASTRPFRFRDATVGSRNGRRRLHGRPARSNDSLSRLSLFPAGPS